MVHRCRFVEIDGSLPVRWHANDVMVFGSHLLTGIDGIGSWLESQGY